MGYAETYFQNKRRFDFSIEALRSKYSNEPGWHRARELFELKSGYLDQIEIAAVESQSRLSICKCRLCGVEFLTAKSNLSRVDLLCVLGCRERHEKSSSAARSRRRNKTADGKRKKRNLNRRRSNKDMGLVLRTRTHAADQRRLQYYGWLIWVIDGLRLDQAALALFIMRVRERLRSRGLDKSRITCDIPDP